MSRQKVRDCFVPRASSMPFVAVIAIVIVTDKLLQRRDETNVGSAGGRASLAPGAGRTSPIVLSGVDAAGADGGMVEPANVRDANLAPQQIVQVGVDFGRGVHGNVHVLIADHVSGNDGTDDRSATPAAIDVDAHSARRG